MCGLTGLWCAPVRPGEKLRRIVTGMAATLRHRGPDASGVWLDDAAAVALGHRRLAILDLSPAGAQPMHSASRRFVIVFNGEIYNHLDLRKALEAENRSPIWRGHADTETLLAAIEAWGLREALIRSRGMFALALWDRQQRRLSLARDRMGEKPLYYGSAGRSLVFASELKALAVHPEFEGRLNEAAVASFLRYAYVPTPFSIYRGIFKLPPGCLIEFGSPADEPTPSAYWSFEQTLHQTASEETAELSLAETSAAVQTCLCDVVRSQMLSDVPLGCFLSGGVDSSLVATLMQKVATQPIRTFSIGFDDPRFNEAPHARRIARHLGTDHTEFVVTEADALGLIDDLPLVYDEPFGDSSQIPTILLSRLTRKHVTVALSGDGGDELFGGYNRYTVAPGLWRAFSRLPGGGRKMAGRLMVALQATGLGDQSLLRKLANRAGLPVTTIDKLAKWGRLLQEVQNFEALYHHLVSICQNPDDLLKTSGELASNRYFQQVGCATGAEWMMAMDAVTYLPDDILVKVDRAAMSASLETRAPFLDRDVVELAGQLPLSAKIDGRIGKRVLREVLYKYVPRELIERPKQGFSIPLDRWLRGELRGWAQALLSPASLNLSGLLNEQAVTQLWVRHQQGRENAGPLLWNILMLQLWLTRTKDQRQVERTACVVN